MVCKFRISTRVHVAKCGYVNETESIQASTFNLNFGFRYSVFGIRNLQEGHFNDDDDKKEALVTSSLNRI